MDFKGFVDKAKEAAALAAKEMAAAVAEPGKGPAAIAPQPEQPQLAAPEPAKEIAVVPTDGFAELRALGAEKVQALMGSFQQALPAIKMAGYELTEFEVELGVTPKLIPHFRRADKSAYEIERAKEALRGNGFGSLILGGLLRAGEVHKQIKVAGFSFAHIEIELGLIPSMKLQYKNDSPADPGPAAAGNRRRPSSGRASGKKRG